MNDTELIDALATVMGRGGDITFRVNRVRFDDTDQWENAFSINGAGLGGGFHRTLRESLTSYFQSLVSLSKVDDHFERFADLLDHEPDNPQGVWCCDRHREERS